MLTKYSFWHQNVAIVDKGRRVGEKSVILLVDGQIKGYGFFHLNYQLTQLVFLENIITPLPNTLINRHLLDQYLRTHPHIKVLNLKEQKPFHNE